MKAKFGIPVPSLRRLPIYYRRLLQAVEQSSFFVSSEDLGRSAGVPGAQVRKDLSYLPECGFPGVGYDARALASQLEEFLGLINDKEAVLVGVGNLGRALALYQGFARYRLQIIALFDSDPAKIGQMIGERQVLPVEKLPNLAQRLHIQMGIIAVPVTAAQQVADAMVEGGITVIWNFAPCSLQVPPHVMVKCEDLAAELAMLSHHIRQRRLAAQEEAKQPEPNTEEY